MLLVMRLNPAFEIQGRRCWWAYASEQRVHIDGRRVGTVAIHPLFSRLNCGLVSRVLGYEEVMPTLATSVGTEALL
jgi:hypothetical protein